MEQGLTCSWQTYHREPNIDALFLFDLAIDIKNISYVCCLWFSFLSWLLQTIDVNVANLPDWNTLLFSELDINIICMLFMFSLRSDYSWWTDLPLQMPVAPLFPVLPWPQQTFTGKGKLKCLRRRCIG